MTKILISMIVDNIIYELNLKIKFIDTNKCEPIRVFSSYIFTQLISTIT